MLEKRIALPFLGKELSQWVYRTSNWLKDNPRKAGAGFVLTACGWVWYENNVVRKDQIVSPNVNNHLVYEVKRVKAEDFDRTVADSTNAAQIKTVGGTLSASPALPVAPPATPAEAQKLYELRQLQETEAKVATKSKGSAMVVKSGQLYVREPHWNIRNSERNWIIMSRDQQQQKDHYWYRSDRSRDDDYARNTYSK
ncbi:Hypothetical protein, putative [Bodo saltans]|uniref:Uncharacterized protein n=1 Tax=Bodo saltans TaxID=75058 RepID=A0A0S4KNW6_BODSA|nr:Hypothetical protein, putative [Bodo saltans]|eukprot:CUI15314.1 Hypothetical protein, putative [Bodo saltans]